jgi:hypothetical protein
LSGRIFRFFFRFLAAMTFESPVQVEDRLPFRLQTPSDEGLSFAIVLDHVPPQMSQQEDL